MSNECRWSQYYEITKCFIMSEVQDPVETTAMEWRHSKDVPIPDATTDWQSLDIYLFSNGQQYSPPRKYHLNGDELHWWDTTLNYLARTHFGPSHAKIELYSTNGRKIKTPLELVNGVAYVAVEPPDAFIDSGYDRYLIRASRSLEKRQPKRSIDEPVDVKSNRKKLADALETVFTSPSALLMPELKFNIVDGHQQNGKVTKSNDKKRSSWQRSTAQRKLNPPQNPIAKRTNNKEKGNIPWNHSNLSNRKNDKIAASTLNNLGKPPLKSKLTKTPYKGLESVPKLTVAPEINEVEIDPMTTQDVNKATRTPDQSKHKVNVIPIDKVLIIDNSDTQKNIDNEQILPVTSLQRNQAEVTSAPMLLTNNESVLDQPIEKSDHLQKSDATLKHTNAKTDVNAVDMNPESPPQQDIVPNGNPNEQFMALINRVDIINFKLNIEIRNAEGAVTNRKVSHSFTNMLKNDKYAQVNNIEREIFINSKSWQSVYPSEAMTDGDTKIIVFNCTCCDNSKYYNNSSYIGTKAVVKENKKCCMFMPQGSMRPDRCPCNEEPGPRPEKTMDPSTNSDYNGKNHLARQPSFMSLETVDTKTYTNSQMPGHLNMSSGVLAPDSKQLIQLVDDQIPKGCGGESRVNFAEPSAQNSTKVDNGEARIPQKKSMEIQAKHEDPKSETIVPNSKTFFTPDDKEMADIVVVRKVSEDPNTRYCVDNSTQTDWEDILLVAKQCENGRYSFHLPPLSAVKNVQP